MQPIAAKHDMYDQRRKFLGNQVPVVKEILKIRSTAVQ